MYPIKFLNNFKNDLFLTEVLKPLRSCAETDAWLIKPRHEQQLVFLLPQCSAQASTVHCIRVLRLLLTNTGGWGATQLNTPNPKQWGKVTNQLTNHSSSNYLCKHPTRHRSSLKAYGEARLTYLFLAHSLKFALVQMCGDVEPAEPARRQRMMQTRRFVFWAVTKMTI